MKSKISILTTLILFSLITTAQNYCVEYLSFNGTSNGYSVDLQLKTVWEDPLIDSFVVERSPAGNFFNQIGTIAPTGTGSTYDFTDNTVDTLHLLLAQYYYRVITYCPTDTTYSWVIIVNYTPLAINENELPEDVSINIYPNPTTGKFTVANATGEIQVYDLFGRLVLRTNKKEIDMGNYPAGIYMVRAGGAVRKLILR